MTRSTKLKNFYYDCISIYQQFKYLFPIWTHRAELIQLEFNVSKVGNRTDIVKSVKVTISDINLRTGSVPKYVMFVIAKCSIAGVPYKKGFK